MKFAAMAGPVCDFGDLPKCIPGFKGINLRVEGFVGGRAIVSERGNARHIADPQLGHTAYLVAAAPPEDTAFR